MHIQRFLKLVYIAMLLSLAPSIAMAQNPEFVKLWGQFRASHPYHIQIVGLSQPDESQHRLLLISEPPPHVTLEGVIALNQPILSNLFVKSNRIGFDGWTKDILIDLPPMDDQDLRVLVDQLHRYLFGTSYKAYAVPIPYPDKSEGETYKIDLHVPASSLSSWLLTQNASGSWTLVIFLCVSLALILMVRRRVLLLVVLSICAGVLIYLKESSTPNKPQVTFASIEGGAKVDIKSLLRAKKSGIYFSTQPGLVVWAFPRTEPLSTYRLEARQFFVDSDIIIGAIASHDQIAVVARERAVPVSLLPPLRVETIMLLAGVQTDELAQSYERTNLFAGKYDDEKDLDWAPIYLSPELIDTEYGSLLNVTDQILKSWSEGGEIQYANFKYPQPNSWPFTGTTRPICKSTRNHFQLEH